MTISEIKRIKENYIVKNTYNSNAIEGNTLTEMETRVIIETGITVAKNFERTPSYLVSQEMLDLIAWYNSEDVTIDRIIEMTCRFINIHPFIDG